MVLVRMRGTKVEDITKYGRDFYDELPPLGFMWVPASETRTKHLDMVHQCKLGRIAHLQRVVRRTQTKRDEPGGSWVIYTHRTYDGVVIAVSNKYRLWHRIQFNPIQLGLNLQLVERDAHHYRHRLTTATRYFVGGGREELGTPLHVDMPSDAHNTKGET